MNTTYSANQTSPLVFICTDSYPGNFIGLSVTAFQVLVLLPIHTWVLWLCTSDIRKGGNLATSDIFTVNLSLLEVMTICLFLFTLVAFALNYQHTLLLATFFSGSYIVGRPFTNCLICVERYIAVAHPGDLPQPSLCEAQIYWCCSGLAADFVLWRLCYFHLSRSPHCSLPSLPSNQSVGDHSL